MCRFITRFTKTSPMRAVRVNIARNCCLAWAAVMAAYCAPANAQESTEFVEMEQRIATVFENYDAPGLSVAIIRDGKVVYTGTFGVRDLETGDPVTSDTQFGIGSLAKSFTGGLIASLADDGLVSLDAHPGQYLADLSGGAPSAPASLTLRHMLSQTSGLPVLDGSISFFPPAEQGALASRLTSFESRCTPGICWEYNNLNFFLLDAVAEQVTMMSKDRLMSERIFDRVRMTGTLSSSEAFATSPNAAIGYVLSEDGLERSSLEYLFGEHVYATATDISLWLGLFMNEGRVGGAQVLPAEYVREAISMQAIDNGAPPSSSEPSVYLFGYGYGWNIKSVDGDFVVHHGGNENGFSTHALFVPAKGYGVIALTNQQSSILPYVVTDIVLRELSGREPLAPEEYPVIVQEIAPLLAGDDVGLVMVDSEPLGLAPQQLTGRYAAEGYGTLEIEWRDGALWLETPLVEFVMIHRGGRTFGIGSTSRTRGGIRPAFFQLEFGGGQRPQTIDFNLAAGGVIFRRVQ